MRGVGVTAKKNDLHVTWVFALQVRCFIFQIHTEVAMSLTQIEADKKPSSGPILYRSMIRAGKQ